MEREKIVERDHLDWETREDIARKSDHRCCHCGKKVYINFGGTVDHFIPIDKGGTNRDINLILLCEDCNQKKSNLILDPLNYIRYLPEEHLRKLDDYYNSYIRSFEYISQHNLMACDQYEVQMVCVNSKFSKHKDLPGTIYTLTRAFPEDLAEIATFYRKASKKHGFPITEEDAYDEIYAWYREGCIYTIKRDGDIKVAMIATISNSDSSNNILTPHLSLYLINYYDNENAGTLMHGVLDHIPTSLIYEQDLKGVGVKAHMYNSCSLAHYILDGRPVKSKDKRFAACFYYAKRAGDTSKYVSEVELLRKMKAAS